jgi:hypothetical protein
MTGARRIGRCAQRRRHRVRRRSSSSVSPAPPAADGAEVLTQASSRSADRTLTAIVQSRQVNGQRPSCTLLAGLAAPSSAYIEAPAPFGSPIFVFAALTTMPRCFCRRDRRALEHGRSRRVLEAIAACAALLAGGLRPTLTVASPTRAPRRTATQPSRWRVFPGDDELYCVGGDALPGGGASCTAAPVRPARRISRFMNDLPRIVST